MRNFLNFNYISDIINILDRKDKFVFFLLLFLILIGAILETLSIALIIPLLKVIIDGDISFDNFITNDKLNSLSSKIQDFNINELITLVILFIVVVFFLKFLYLLNLSWLNAKYNSKILYNTSVKLFKKYINNSYSFHVNNNSGKLIENVNGEVNLYCGSVIAPFFILITEILISIFIFALVLYVNFVCSFSLLYTNKKKKLINGEIYDKSMLC